MDHYPQYHKNEVWDPPDWVFSSVYTMTPKEAARELGISRPTLVRYTDELGLTVYRNWNRWRYYSRQEIMELKEEARSKSIQEVMKRRARDK